MLAAFVPLILMVLLLLGAVTAATLWAEYGGRRPPPADNEEPREEGHPQDGGDDSAAEGPEEEDDRPWERPGAVRLDCEPHRGTMLLWLGRVSLWLIAGAILASFLALLPVIPLAVTVMVMASRDRAKMRAGTMDPAGEGPTRKGARYAVAALATLVLLVLACGAFVAVMIALDRF